MIIKNVDNAEYSLKHGTYGGLSGLKDGLIIDGNDYIIKFPKNARDLKRHEEMLYTNDPVSEYIGSQIYKIIGIPVHETELVERRGKIAVACKDFIDDNKRERLIEIRTIKNSANEKLSELLEHNFSNTGSSHVVELEEIMLHLQYNEILKNVNGINDRFFDMMVIDTLINNSDRNNGNWGIIRAPGEGDRLAPVFDNGGAFNGKTPDSRLEKLFQNKDNFKSSIAGSISVFGKNGKNYLVKELIGLELPGFHEAALRNVPIIEKKLNDMKYMIEQIPDIACSKIRKEFYKASLDIRLEIFLEKELEKDIQDKEDQDKYPPSMPFIELIDKATKECIQENKSNINLYKKQNSPGGDSPGGNR